MTPTNSREVSLSLSRDRLARALSKLDRLSRDAAETIAHLRQEKRELEAQLQGQIQDITARAEQDRARLEEQLADFTRRFEQERSNFEQRAVLLQSVTAESEERSRAFDEVTSRLSELESILEDQQSANSELRLALESRAAEILDRDGLIASLRTEIEEWKQKAGTLQSAQADVAAERDDYRKQLYEQERMQAQWALQLTPEECENAGKTIDKLIEQISSIESRIASTQNA